MVIWLFDVYWKVVLFVSFNMIQEDVKMIIDGLDDYIIIFVMEVNFNWELMGFDMIFESILC